MNDRSQADVDRALASLGGEPFRYVSFGIGQLRWPDRKRNVSAPPPQPQPRPEPVAEPEPDYEPPAALSDRTTPAQFDTDEPDPMTFEAGADLADYEPAPVVAEPPLPVPGALATAEVSLADHAEPFAAPERLPPAFAAHPLVAPSAQPVAQPEPEPEPEAEPEAEAGSEPAYAAPKPPRMMGAWTRSALGADRPTVADMFRRLSNDTGTVAPPSRKAPPSPTPDFTGGENRIQEPEPRERPMPRPGASRRGQEPEPPTRQEPRSDIALSGALPALNELFRRR